MRTYRRTHALRSPTAPCRFSFAATGPRASQFGIRNSPPFLVHRDLQGFGTGTCNLRASHLGHEFTLGDLKQIGRFQTRKQIERTRDESRPSGLVAGSKARAVVPVEVLVEEKVIFPVRVFLKFLGSTVDRALTIRIEEKDAG
jgi:hypothetical protein